MIVKKNIVLYLILISNVFFLLSAILKKVTLGNFWYITHSNSLVGFQSYIESKLNVFYFNINIYNLFLEIMSYNVFLFIGFFFLLISFLFFIRSYRP